MSGGAKKKKAKITAAPAARAAAMAVAAEFEARVAHGDHRIAMLDLPPRWLGGGAARNAAEAKNLLLDDAWKAAVAEVGKTRKAAKAEAAAAAAAAKAEAEAKAAARSNFVAELMGEKFTKAEVERALTAGVGLDKAAARSHIAIKRQQEKERREAKAAEAAAEAAAWAALPVWTDRGGGGVDISADGRTTSKSYNGYSSARGARLPMSGAVSLKTAGPRENLYVGLAAAKKNLKNADNSKIKLDPDTWMIGCFEGNKHIGDKTVCPPCPNGGCCPGSWTEIGSKQIITIEWDQKGVSFLVDGVRRGEKHEWGKPPRGGVRVVAQLDLKGQSVAFVPDPFAKKKITILPGK